MSSVPSHISFFNRYFTIVKLYDQLRHRGLHKTETIMRNRIHKDCILTEVKRFRRLLKEISESKIRKDGRLTVSMGLGNKLVLWCLRVMPNHDECDTWSK